MPDETLKALVEAQNQIIAIQRNVINTMKADLAAVSSRLYRVEVQCNNHEAYLLSFGEETDEAERPHLV